MSRQGLTEMLIEEVTPTLPPGLSIRSGVQSDTMYSGPASSSFEYPHGLDDEAFVRTFLDFVQDTVAELNGEDWPRVGDRRLDVHVGTRGGRVRIWFTPGGGPFAADPEAE